MEPGVATAVSILRHVRSDEVADHAGESVRHLLGHRHLATVESLGAQRAHSLCQARPVPAEVYDHMRIESAVSFIHGFDQQVLGMLTDGDAPLMGELRRWTGQLSPLVFTDMARAGKLSVMASGPRAAFETVAPYLACFGPSVTYVGEGDVGVRDAPFGFKRRALCLREGALVEFKAQFVDLIVEEHDVCLRLHDGDGRRAQEDRVKDRTATGEAGDGGSRFCRGIRQNWGHPSYLTRTDEPYARTSLREENRGPAGVATACRHLPAQQPCHLQQRRKVAGRRGPNVMTMERQPPFSHSAGRQCVSDESPHG